MLLLGYAYIYMPWLIASKSIREIKPEQSSSVPDWARSFHFSHGEATFYEQPMPSEAGNYTIIVLTLFALIFLSGYICNLFKNLH